MNPIAKDILAHEGVLRRSGRYRYGSGKNPFQRSGDFLSRYEELQKQGLSEVDVARMMGFVNEYTGRTQTQHLRTQIALAKEERRNVAYVTAKNLRDKGLSLNDIAQKMGYANDSSIRSLLNEKTEAKMRLAKSTADFLKEQVDAKGMIDIGAQVNSELGISPEKLRQAVYILEAEGYEVLGGRAPQVTNPGKMITLKVIAPPGTPKKSIYEFDKIHQIREYTSFDDGKTFKTFRYPKSMDSKRLDICYAEDGGAEQDGLIEIRRGVKDLSLNNSSYAQVRILVDDNRYIKGMAAYSDDLPKGIDIRFNTNKSKNVPKLDVLKKITEDPVNPFGSLIKANGQSEYIDDKGERQLSLINKRAEEGDWNDWSKTLPSQFLSKQRLSLIKKQLALSLADEQVALEDIRSLNNPTIKKHLLKTYSESADAKAVELDAAAFPRQRYQVIMPVPSMKDNEVYAPNFKPGERVALVRFPHGGVFEIPVLRVNNKQQEAKKMIGNAPIDAVCINSKVAAQLSGADFDGDTVLVIPLNDKIDIHAKPPLGGLKNFDPKMEYPEKPNMRYMQYIDADGKKKDNTQIEMGKISNLVTDMTLKGAEDEEITKAVKHSMVVIDAAKHKLDYKRSEVENDIKALKKLYQGRIDPKTGRYSTSAATLISAAKSPTSILKRQGSPRIDPKTGELIFKLADEPTYVNKKTGKIIVKTQASTKMEDTKDAKILSSGTLVEEAYAQYANRLKTLANEARKDIVFAGKTEYKAEAKQVYQKEHESLKAKLAVALMNAPRERAAQLLSNSVLKATKQEYPDITSKELTKKAQQSLETARNKVGAKKKYIEITDKEWEAIQAGAISENMLNQILENTKIEKLYERALPRDTTTLSAAKINKIKQMNNSGYSTIDIAESLNVSVSTIYPYLK